MPGRCTALLVMSRERRVVLLDHLLSLNAEILEASDCGEAGKMLRQHPNIQVVLTDQSLPDGSWLEVLSEVGESQSRAEVVVCARLADERLWTRVLETGGVDLLVEPYQEREVARILRSATTPHPIRRLAAAS